MAGETKLGAGVVPIRAKLDDLEKDLEKARSKVETALGGVADKVGKTFEEAGEKVKSGLAKIDAKALTDVGTKLSAGVTLPLLAAGGAALKFSTDFNASMANIATLIPGNIARVNELKGVVQQMAIDVGKSTSDISGGLYEVISSFGDTADTVKILDINTRAGAAGLSTTLEAIKLTSAVTKGYGDTSAEAVQKVADLSFQTVNLGQTTFPELAASMGNVVPIASALGVEQETLFASMATLTGVTGSAAEVSTQLRATYQALLNPTKEMSGAISMVATKLDEQGRLAGGPLVDDWRQMSAEYERATQKANDLAAQAAKVNRTTKQGEKTYNDLMKQQKAAWKTVEEWGKAVEGAGAALGPTLVKSVGVTNAIALLSDTAGGNTATLSKMFGSVESLNAVLALSGPQADSFKEKLAAMGNVAGAVDTAFKEQTGGINKVGFSLEQAKVKAEVAAQKFGDGLAPALGKAVDAAQPLLDLMIKLGEGFSKLDPNVQTVILAIGGLAAALGPVLMAVGMAIPAIAAIAPVVGAVAVAIGGLISLPIAAIIALIVGLFVAWQTNFLGIRDITASVVAWVGQAIQDVIGFFSGGLGPALEKVGAFLGQVWSSIAGEAGNWAGKVTSILGERLAAGQANLAAAWSSTVGAAWQGVVSTVSGAISAAGATLGAVWQGAVVPAFEAVTGTIGSVVVSGLSTLAGVWQSTLLPPLQAVGGFITGTLVPFFQALANVGLAVVEVASRALAGLWQKVLLPALQSVASAIVGPVNAALQAVSGFITGTAIPAWEALNTFISGNVQAVLTAISGFITGTVVPAWEALSAFVETNVQEALSAVSDFITGTVVPALESLASFVTDNLQAAWESLASFLSGQWARVVDGLTTFVNGTLLPALRGLADFVVGALLTDWRMLTDFFTGTLQPAFNTIADTVRNVVGSALQWLKSSVVDPLIGAFNSIAGKIQSVTGTLNTLATSIRSLQLPDWLTPGSPTPLELGLEGIARALGTVDQAMLPSISLPTAPPALAAASVGGGAAETLLAGATLTPSTSRSITGPLIGQVIVRDEADEDRLVKKIWAMLLDDREATFAGGVA